MKRRVLFVAFAAFLFSLTSVCQTFAADIKTFDLKKYYAKANGKKAADLKTALHSVIAKHTNIGYDGLLEAYHDTDKRADGYLRDWYSNATRYVIGGPAENHSYKGEGDGYNREHLVPQSWFGSGEMKSDLFQVVPSDGYVNNRRGNYPFGENRGETYTSANGYSKVGACTVSGYSGQCFEPNDEIKGDIARIYFYVLACYENLHPNWTGGSASQFFDGKKYPGLKDWALKMLLRWAKQDPVDQVEKARNDSAYTKQENRNPFVDYPSLCEYVWGDSVSYVFDINQPHGQSTVENPDPQPGDDPDPQPGDDPDPQPEDPEVNPEAGSGTIVFAELTWKGATHATYGKGYTATANGLTLSYFKATSGVEPVDVSKYGELRFYDKSVFIIEGAEITGVTFHAGDKKGEIVIDGKTLSFEGSELSWTGSMNPFICTASAQSRISSIDVTVKAAEPETVVSVQSFSLLPDSLKVFSADGKYLGRKIPARRGTYVVRRGRTVRKYMVK